ncbi:ABC-2 type transport system permease protein [Kineococcus xinjiangensis]|uniref:ABC-2 type transport system permease protein n=1 Tax=Kineococcus xinjiangensis TaxID=512762 RepID=A0A2S6ICW9_9ACTN|nr:ABC transporter permease [Kineococcus xinjiangensis]PPK92010.1 ABC-2 type transport system permease protein [Kineococcus xinjiangensis]
MTAPTAPAATTAPLASGRRGASAARLTLLHARSQVLEALRVPVAVVGTTAFPALSLLFFVVSQPQIARDPALSTAAAAQLSVFAVMSVCLFTYGASTAEERALPWDAHLRTLPVGAGPRLGAKLLTGTAFGLLGLLPVVLLAAVLTEAALPVHRWLPSVAAVVAGALPVAVLGLAIGFSLSSRAALALAQVLLLPLAFAGGLFFPPAMFPAWLDAVSRWLPTRAARDLVVGAATGAPVPASTLPVLAGWTLLLAALAVAAQRRDEGRRFR